MKTRQYSLISSLALFCLFLIGSAGLLTSCERDEDDSYVYEEMGEPFDNPKYTTTQTVSDEGQRNTIAFDALGYMTGTSDLGLDRDVNVAVMTFASEIYSWWAGSVAADVYFCPERQGTYFGSFYLKDWPAMGNPDYTIDEQLTANAEQKDLITGLVGAQKTSLLALVDTREEVSNELRKFLKGSMASSTAVQTLSEQYGRYDGEIIYAYATAFSQVFKSLSESQKSQLTALAANLGYIDPTGASLYSAPIAVPVVENTDFLFK
jgi:hypothetical protein